MKLEIRDLDIRFGDRQVVELERLDVGAGEIVGIVGESGSGKSMTSLAILGLTATLGARVSGSIKLDGQELVGAPESALRAVRGSRIAMIFQHPVSAFNPVFRVGDVFVRALRLHGATKAEARERAHAALAEVMLAPALLERYPHQLSGGQAQRVAVARVLASKPVLILADEPTSQLDRENGGHLIDVLLHAAEVSGAALLVSTHDQAIAERFPVRWTVADGRVSIDGQPVSLELVS
jgi:ABC-type glutathione transport system ATPase component